MEKNLARYDNYRAIIKEFSKSKGISFRSLAESTYIHSSYFSRVMVGKADFSEEQLYLIGKCFNFKEWELEYFLLLGDYQRSGNVQHQIFLKNKISVIQKRKLKLVSELEGVHSKFTEQEVSNYYAEAVTAKIHMYLTLGRYCDNPSLLCKKIYISEKKLKSQLTLLKDLKIIAIKGGKVQVLKTHVHLDESHPASPNNHINWRLEAINKISKKEIQPTDYHLSATFSTNEKTKTKVRDLFKDFVLKAQKEVSKSPPKESDKVYYLGLDLF
jgi:uncharacterized protein (TIGR02147 family)